MRCSHKPGRPCVRSGCAQAAFALASLAMCGVAGAQDAKVYAANSSNSRIVSVQFNPPATTVVNTDANALVQLRDIAVRDDGLSGVNLLATDRNGGKIVFYQDAKGAGKVVYDASLAAGPARPDGMSLDLAGNLYVMNSGQGNSGGGLSQVWVLRRDANCVGANCLPGGYHAPFGLIDGNVQVTTVINGLPTIFEADLLPETLVAQSNGGALQAGDLLVLTVPGALVRYHASDIATFLQQLAAGQVPAQLTPDTLIHPSGASVPEDQRFPVGVDPNGMARTINGELLVTVSDGSVLRFGPNMHRVTDGAGHFVNFAAGQGQGDFKIAVGLQDGMQRAFITHQQRGELRRYTFLGSGVGLLDSVFSNFQFPIGVSTTTSNTVPAPAGNLVVVDPNSIMTTQLTKVTVGGLVNGTVSVFPDPRESEENTPPNLPLHRSLFLDELRADLPHVEIPAWARAFRFGDPNTGTPAFIFIETKSNIGVSGVIDHHALEDELLGYDPSCTDPDVTKQPFLFWSPDADDPPIVEGKKFIDTTTGCGSIRGMTQNLSYFLAGVRVTEPIKTLASDKLNSLNQVINGATCMDKQLRKKLTTLMTSALANFALGNYAAVSATLSQIDTQVGAAPGSFGKCTTNVSGEIQARCRSEIFVLSKLQ